MNQLKNSCMGAEKMSFNSNQTQNEFSKSFFVSFESDFEFQLNDFISYIKIT